MWYQIVQLFYIIVSDILGDFVLLKMPKYQLLCSKTKKMEKTVEVEPHGRSGSMLFQFTNFNSFHTNKSDFLCVSNRTYYTVNPKFFFTYTIK